MNRSILIVTCDFLVLAAMSLSIGMTEVGDPAGAAKISSPATRLVEMIDEELARHEAVKQQKDELEKRLEEFRVLALQDEKQIASKEEEVAQARAKLDETLAALTKSREELSFEKTKSEQERAKSAAELANTLAALTKSREDLSSEKTKSEQELAKSAAELAKVKQELDEREDALKRSAAVIAQKESELELSAKEIQERDKAIRESESLLETSERSLVKATLDKAAADAKLQQSEKSLSRASGQLEMTKLELEALREQARIDRARADEALAKFHAAEVELVETRSKLTTAETQLNGMVRVLTDVNSDLVKAKSDLNESRQTLAETKETLAETKESLAVTKETVAQNEKMMGEKDKQIADKQRDLAETRKEAEELKKMLNNDVLTSYNASALELSFHLVNDRLFNNIEIDKSFFLPAVTLGGKNWLVSAFRDTTGLNLHSGYTKVTELQYKVRRPQSKDKWTDVAGPALCLADDSRVCLFPVDAGKAEPIRAITFAALRERGLDNLTLFKSGTFSKESADITGRCSVSMEQGDNYLYIRNPNRSSSELKADIGDIVISKEGFFVGVVVKVSSNDLGQTSTARCYVFPGEPDLSKAFRLRLTKEPSQTLFYDFVNGHEELRKRADQLDKGK